MFLTDVTQQTISQWLTHYGSGTLFVCLALGIFGLPIPDETLLVLAGLLMAKGKLSIYLTIPLAFIGAMVGISLSYLFGYFAGHGLLNKYGKYVGVTQKKLDYMHEWYERFGKWTLLFGYYIPGVRHLTGIAAGTAYLKYWEFALFAYIGAFVWSCTFMSIGFFFYSAWQKGIF
ncbi:MAG: DedA family protein [Gammaproteobacteria bacterium]